jgi:hypothetical protein
MDEVNRVPGDISGALPFEEAEVEDTWPGIVYVGESCRRVDAVLIVLCQCS